MAIKYELVRPTLKTGDVVLFAGKGWVSLVIKWFCTLCRLKRSRWQHIGVVVRYNKRILLFESTMQRAGKKGVQLNFLSRVIREHKGKAAIRKLMIDNPDISREKIQETAEKFVKKNLGKPYEAGLLELAGSAFDGLILGHNKPDDSTVFCSEIVAMLYKSLGLLAGDVAPNELTPDDFGYNQLVDKLMADKGDGYLDYEIEIICGKV